jgi:oligopeptide/dipeptide ABC transporter ATP-binding protein
MGEPVLAISGLQVSLQTRRGVLTAIDDFDLTVDAGETVALVGESGCGKTLTALSVMRLLPDPPARISFGAIRLGSRDLATVSEREMREVRGREASMIFQDPISALNPVTTIGHQLVEVLRAHTDLSSRAARARAVALLDSVGIPAAASRFDDYPHRLSGGTCQRVMVAIAVACRPRLLIADEPTTALDVTIQAQVLALLARLQHETGMAMLFITHDLGVVAEVAQRVAVMYAGYKVEEAAVDDLFDAPLHPYTRGLLAATPTPGTLADRLTEIPGAVPDLAARAPGCAFAPRCPSAFDACRQARPRLHAPAPGRKVACFAVERDAAG